MITSLFRAPLSLLCVLFVGCSSRGEDPITVDIRPLIEAIEADRLEACVGEDILVSVRPLVLGERLEIKIDGEMGNPAVVHIKEAGVRKIRVGASSGTTAKDYAELEVTGLPCEVPTALEVRHSFTRERPDEVVFEVVPKSFDPDGATYVWDFGDGTLAETPVARVVKGYALREQSGPESTFVVTVRAENRFGHRATRRLSLTLRNPSFLPGVEGAIRLAVDYDRFLREDFVRIKNITQEAVALVEIEALVRSCKGGEPRRQPLALARVVGEEAVAIGAGELWSKTLTLPFAELGDEPCSALLTIRGEQGGRAVLAEFSFELSPSKKSAKVIDAELSQKVRAARELLGVSRVSVEELMQLEADGKL